MFYVSIFILWIILCIGNNNKVSSSGKKMEVIVIK